MHQGGLPRPSSGFRIVPVVALVMLATLAFGSGAADAAGPTLCSGTLTSVSLHGNVRVPSGQTCVLVESTVVGDVAVDPGGTLITQGSTITGNVRSNYGAVSLGPDKHAGPTSVSGRSAVGKPWSGLRALRNRATV